MHLSKNHSTGSPRQAALVIIALLHFLLLFILAVAWCWERTNLDNANVLLEIMTKGSFRIFDWRIINFPTQIPLLVGLKLGLSIPWLVRLFSLGFVLTAAGIVVLFFRLRLGRGFVMAALLATVVGVRMNYFVPTSEVYLSILLGLLAAPLLVDDILKKRLLGLGLLVVAILSHPLVALFVPLMLLYLLINKWKDGHPLFTWWNSALIPLVALLAIASTYTWTPYDFDKMPTQGGLAQALQNLATNVVPMLKGLGQRYILLLASFLGLVAWYVYSRKWWLLLLNLGFALVYLLILASAFDFSFVTQVPETEFERFVYPMLVFFVAQVCLEVDRHFDAIPFSKWLVPLVLVLVLVAQYLNLYEPYLMFHNKTKQLAAVVNQAKAAGLSKAYVDQDIYRQWDVLECHNHSLTLLLSAKNGPSGALQVVVADSLEQRVCDTLNPSRLFITNTYQPLINDFPKQYFELKLAAYQPLKIAKPVGSAQPWLEKYRSVVPLPF